MSTPIPSTLFPSPLGSNESHHKELLFYSQHPRLKRISAHESGLIVHDVMKHSIEAVGVTGSHDAGGLVHSWLFNWQFG
jgi:hypothetical protein